MDANPFQSARRYLNATPSARLGAVVLSALASALLVLLVPVLYLFVDLLVYQGQVPAYQSLSARQQAAFQDEWTAGLSQAPDVTDASSKLYGPAAQLAKSDELNWQAATHAYLARRVGPEAAEAYESQLRSGDKLGVLAPVARERGRWTGAVLGWFAGWNPWAWRPTESGSADTRYLTGLFLLGFTLLALRTLALAAANHLATNATLDAATRLRRAVYTHAYRVSAVAVRPDAQDEVGDVVTRRVEQVQHGLAAWLTGTVRWQVLTTLLLAVLLLVHFWLALSLLLLAGAVWLVAGQAAAWFRRDARRAGRRADARLDMMRESVAQAQLVKAYLMERFSVGSPGTELEFAL